MDLTKLLIRIYKSEFGKNVLTLFTGASIAQIIPFLVAPILSRMYAPEHFGELGIIMSVAGIFSIIATFQYESAIMLPKKDEDAFNILVLAICITVIISSLSYLVVSAFGSEIAKQLNSNSFKEWTFIIPVFVFLAGLYNSLNIWASRKKQFKRLAIRQIAQSATGAATKLILGWLKHMTVGLIWGTIAGKITSTGVLAFMTIKDNKALFKSVRLKEIKKNAIKYQDFPKYTMWQGFLDLLNASGVIFILSSFYGVAVVGLYAFTLGMLQKPSVMIGTAVSQVFYQNASKKVANGESIYKDTLRLIKNLAMIGGIIFFPILIIGPYIFSFIFGQKWWEAGVIAQIISPWLFLQFITSPLANIAMIKNKQKEFLFISMGMNILIPTVFFLYGWFQKEYQYAFIAVSGIIVVYLVVASKWIIGLIKAKKTILKNEKN